MKEINNNIQESYCSFEVSKLLKERGFNVNIDLYYISLIPTLKAIKQNITANYFSSSFIKAPTHALAIQWLWVNFGVWIVVYIDTSEFESTKFYFIVEKEENLNFGKYWDTPQEATEEALLYVLNNLIP